MKNKIFIILIVIAFIISCSNNNTNPNDGEKIKEKEELGNVETPTDNGIGSNNNGNTDNNNPPTDNNVDNNDNTTEKPPLPPLDNYLHMYTGTARYYIKTLDDAVVTSHTDENIYVEIYDDSIVVSSGATFFFEHIKRPSDKEYQSTEYYNGATYNLTLKINDDGTANLRLSIRDSEYSYHFDADNLPEFKNN